ncbi:uncharacterized protein LOC131313809 [Rhododendron vialii]|uniref:uncharacterized protein LOC131313809 n=1 Tax=Rhododendron vialii TaxID=182163 RepID=UPI00265DAD07|nr:uncharacterized protein LOC131313809 [Rhododendron vialii]
MLKGRDNDTGPIEKEGNLMKNSDFEEEEENEDNVALLAFNIWRSSPGKEEQNQISSNPSEVAAPNTEFQPFREELEVGISRIEIFSNKTEQQRCSKSVKFILQLYRDKNLWAYFLAFCGQISSYRDNNKGDDIPSARDIRDEFQYREQHAHRYSGTAKKHFLANSGTENEVNLLLTDSRFTDWHMKLLIPQDSSTEWVITGWKDFFSAQNSEDLGLISFYIPSCPDHNKHYLIDSLKIRSMQMEKQRRLQNQPELRIDAQGGYMNTMLKRACQTLGVPNNMASEREGHKGRGTNSRKSPITRSDDDFIGNSYEGNETAAGHSPGNSSFRKHLTRSDVRCGSLYVPGEVSEQHFPSPKPPEKGYEEETILNVLDHQNKTWVMTFKRYPKRCLIGGNWGEFVRRHRLEAKDEIIFSKVEHHQASDGKHYLIRFKKNSNAAASGS